MSFFATQIRIARPVKDLSLIRRFYSEGLGLTEIGHFEKHAGISGIMLGMPDESVHLEFTEHEDAIGIAPPSDDHLLVFYIQSAEEFEKLTAHMASMGYPTAAPANPYWRGISLTYADPDGWRVVLVSRSGFKIG